MSRPSHIVQPGAPLEPRIVAVEGRGSDLTLALEAGVPLLEAVRRGFAAYGFANGAVELHGVRLAPFAYVMPALSKTPANAAFYSDIFRPGAARIDRGAMTFGSRDGAPFFHCHGLWVEADGKHSGGHILPEEAVVAERCTVSAFGLSGAAFVAEPDSETNFKIFGPLAAPAGKGDTRAFALRLRPNQDFCTALEQFCAEKGIRNARIRGGVGSTIGASFDDGQTTDNFATEVYIEQGTVAPDASGALVATLDVGLIDYTGAIARGRLKRGDNPVLMTFELVVEAG